MNKGINAVLEITQSHVKLAVAKSEPSGNTITFLGAKNIVEISNQVVAEAIKELISESKVKPQSLTCIIPRSSTIVRHLKLPSQDPAEIENMLDFQIKERIPYSREDIISDYLTIRRDEKGYSDILLATAHKDVVERYIEILNSINISPDICSLSSLGVSKWFGSYQARGHKADKGVVLLVNLDSAVTDLCFCLGKDLISSRSISFGLNDINDEKKEGFLEQIHLTLTTYRKEKNNPDVSRIILITQTDKAEVLSQKLKSEFYLPVEIINPLDAISKGKDSFSVASSGLGDVSFAAVVGLALEREDEELNLLPDQIRERQKIKSLKKEFVFTGSVLVLVILFAIASVSINIYKKGQHLNQIDAKLKELGPEAEEIKDATKKLDLIKEHLNFSGSGIDIIYELYNILPTSMSLNVFNLDDKGNLTLQGVSSQMSDIFGFQSNLEKSNNFKNVEVKYASKRRTRQGELTDFRIVCQVSGK